jgi:uncharacterized protein YjbI with pentapeptide repeats
MLDIAEEMQRREATGRGKGWSESDALERWAKWTGPAAMSSFIHKFLLSEIELLPVSEVRALHRYFTQLFNYVLHSGLPMEKILLPTYSDAVFQARNANESLLVALNACAKVLREVSAIEHPTPTTFGDWLKNVQGQRGGPANVLATKCLSWLNLAGIEVPYADFFDADLSNSNMRDIRARGATFERANLDGANLRMARLTLANLRNSDLRNACLEGVDFNSANLNAAKLQGCKIYDSDFRGANLHNANFAGSILLNIEVDDENFLNADFTKVHELKILTEQEARERGNVRYRHSEALSRSNSVN